MSGSGISWAIYKSAPCSRQITTPAPHRSIFTGRMPFLPPNQQRQSTEGQYTNTSANSDQPITRRLRSEATPQWVPVDRIVPLEESERSTNWARNQRVLLRTCRRDRMPSELACMRLDPGATMGNESPAEAGR